MAYTNGFYLLRWQVLERDDFTCQYCGAFAPNVRLEVDHVIPVSQGGTDTLDNLKTACFACNCGKGDGLRVRTATRHGSTGPTMLDLATEFLTDNETGSAPVIAKAIGRHRSDVARLLSSHPNFVRVGFQGRRMVYALA